MKYNMSKPYCKEVLDHLHHTQVEILKEYIRICEKYELPYFGVYGTAIGAVRHQGFIPWDDDVDVAMLRVDYEKFLAVAPRELGSRFRIMTPETDRRYACTVTHLQLVNTKFVPRFSVGSDYPMCIDVDIFPLDDLAPTKREMLRQGRRTNFLGRLLFLSGNKYPVIPIEGFLGWLAGKTCVTIYFILRYLRVSPQKIYRQYVKEATRFNHRGGDWVTSFEYSGGLKDRIKKTALFPVEKVQFEDIEIALPHNNHEFLTKVYGDYLQIPPRERQINHAPYEIQFEEKE